MIGFINPANVESLKVGETWHVAITDVKERFCIVMPVYISKSKEETETQMMFFTKD